MEKKIIYYKIIFIVDYGCKDDLKNRDKEYRIDNCVNTYQVER